MYIIYLIKENIFHNLHIYRKYFTHLFFVGIESVRLDIVILKDETNYLGAYIKYLTTFRHLPNKRNITSGYKMKIPSRSNTILGTSEFSSFAETKRNAPSMIYIQSTWRLTGDILNKWIFLLLEHKMCNISCV